jgi:hypothetical protein
VREPVTVDGRECRHGANLARTWLRLAAISKSAPPIIELLSELRESERHAS